MCRTNWLPGFPAMSEMPAYQSFKVVTCFLPAGRGKEILAALRKQKDLSSAFVHHARGAGVESVHGNKAPFYVEREVISVLVPAEQANEIFEFLYFTAGLDRPHAGMVLMEKAIRGMACSLPAGMSDEA